MTILCVPIRLLADNLQLYARAEGEQRVDTLHLAVVAGVAVQQEDMGVTAALAGRVGLVFRHAPAVLAGLARQKQAERAAHALGARFKAPQPGAVRADAPALPLLFTQHVRIIENMLAPAPPHAVGTAFLRAFVGAGRGIAVTVHHGLAEPGDIVGDAGALAFALRRPLRFADVVGGQARQRQTDAHVDVGQRAADGVAALQHRNVGIKRRIEGRISLGGQLHVGQRIGEVIVLPGGIDDDIRLEFLQNGQHRMPDGVEIAGIRRFGRQGDIDGAAQRRRAAAFRQEACV